jgi:hypothetical protein
MRELTLVLPFFRNQGMLEEQQRVWMAYPEAVRRALHVVIVDDCSPKAHRVHHKGITADGFGSLRVYRITKKERWNWLACRNLGATVAQTEWMILTDIDHVIPPESMAGVMQDPSLRGSDAYRFRRVTATRTWPYRADDLPEYKRHNDSWLLTKTLFFSPFEFRADGRYLRGISGYDERLSGCYGTSGEFTYRLEATARAIGYRDEVLVRYPREIIADASTPPTIYTRKNDPDNEKDLRKRKDARDRIAGWTPLHGLVPSELIYDSRPVAQPC